MIKIYKEGEHVPFGLSVQWVNGPILYYRKKDKVNFGSKIHRLRFRYTDMNIFYTLEGAFKIERMWQLHK